MSNKDFHYRIIKARLAETLIKELFQACGYFVFEYGMERTLPLLMQNIKGQKDETAINIRSMPDFVVQNAEDGTLKYVEVKYRKNGAFNRTELIKDYPYKNAVFIIVSQNNIQIITYKNLQTGRALPEKHHYNIEYTRQFDLNRDIVLEYKKYASTFFKDVD